MAEETRAILRALNGPVEMLKRSAETMASASTRFDRIDAELVKAARQRLKTQEELATFRSDITARVDALARRMDELESLVDKSAEEARAARSEIVTLENEILNAVQTGLSNMADANEVIADIGDPADLEIVVDLLSSDAVRVHPGSKVTITEWDGDHDLAATVHVVEPAG